MHTTPDILYCTLASGERYISVEDLHALDDIAQATVEVPHWSRPNKPAKLLLRGLNLVQQEKINDQARIKDRFGEIRKDRAKFCTLTLQEACVQPVLTDEQAKGLAKKCAPVLEALTSFVWNELSYHSPESIEQINTMVHDLANLPAEPESQSE